MTPSHLPKLLWETSLRNRKAPIPPLQREKLHIIVRRTMAENSDGNIVQVPIRDRYILRDKLAQHGKYANNSVIKSSDFVESCSYVCLITTYYLQ